MAGGLVRGKLALCVVLMGSAAALPWSSLARAQAIDSVMSRPRPAYDAPGVELGGFNLLPSLTAGYTYDDNVYLTDSDTKGDSFLAIHPKVSLLSNWSQDALDVFGDLTQYEYATQYSNNRLDWNIGGRGRLDVDQGVNLTTNVLASQQHEQRNSPNDPTFIAAPVQFHQDHADATFTDRHFRVGFDLGGTVDHYDFTNTDLVGGGKLVNKDRDENTYTGFASVFYEFCPGCAAFVRGTHTATDYVQHSDRDGLDRSSTGNEVDTGVKFFVTSLINAEAYLGYLSHQFHDPLPDVSGLDFGGKLQWNITPLMTLHALAARTLVDTTLAATSAEDNRQVSAGLDYELLRNLIIQSQADYTYSTFPGSSLINQVTALNLAAKVLINPFLSATARITPSWRDSNESGQSYSDLMFGLSVTGQF